MINVILTVWKRDTLERQLQAIQKQTADVSEIYVYQNEQHVNVDNLKEKYKFKHVHSKDVNFKFHGRFTLPLLFDSKYTAIFDDDTIPNPKWLQHCKELCDEKNCIVGANCRNYNKTGCGCGDGNTNHIKCDIVGHCWFFKTEWIHYMWRENPPTYDNGEDIHFCASCKIHGDIDSYFPAQPSANPDVWGDVMQNLGVDEHSTFKKQGHNNVRFGLYDYWIGKGWKTNP